MPNDQSWIADLLSGFTQLWIDDVQLVATGNNPPPVKGLNFLSGVSAVYNAFTKRFDITVTAGRTALVYTNVDGVVPNTTQDFLIGFSGLTGNHQVTLPATPAIGQVVIVKDLDGSLASHNFTINAGSNNIDGASTFVLSSTQGAKASTSLAYFGGGKWGTV